MTPKPYAGWLSMEPDRANLELRPDAPPPEPRRLGCSVFVLLLIAVASSWTGPERALPSIATGRQPITALAAPSSRITVFAPLGRSDQENPDPPPVTSRITGIVPAAVTRSGTWAYAKASHGPDYLAIPEGRGWHVTVCGPKGCLDRVSTDAGPELWLQRAGRIGDLAAVMFEDICGPLSAGLCDGSYTITGRANQHPQDPPPHPDDDRLRIEDGGPQVTTPPTDTED